MRKIEKLDISRFRLVGVADAAGRCVLQITVPQGSVWMIERMTCRNSGAAVSQLRVYIGAETDENIVDGSDTGQFDIADEASPIYVPSGETISFVWIGATAGSSCRIMAQYGIYAYTQTTPKQHVLAPTEDLPYGMDLPFTGRKITAGYGGGGW